MNDESDSRAARALAVFLGAAGVTHFVIPRFYVYSPLAREVHVAGVQRFARKLAHMTR